MVGNIVTSLHEKFNYETKKFERIENLTTTTPRRRPFPASKNNSGIISYIYIFICCKAQYTPPTPTRRNCRVSSRRRCVHEFATGWRQFRRVVGVNTPVGSRDPYGCVVRSHRRIRLQSSRIHVHTADADATRLDSFVSSASAVCIGLKEIT